MDLFGVLLSDQLSPLVFFVTENIVMGRDRRWIWLNLHGLDTRFAPLIAIFLLLTPLCFHEILSGAGLRASFRTLLLVPIETFDT